MMSRNKQPQSHGNIRQPAGGYPRGAVSFLRALGAPDAAALVAWSVEARPDAGWAAWLRGQSLAPFAFYRLREAGVLTRLPADAQRGLQNAYYAAAGRNAVQRRETEAVLRALDDARIETVLMKGTPLAYTVYANPACRLKGDLDIWLPPAQLPAAIEALQPLGYAPRDKSNRPAAFIALTGGEQQLFGRDPGTGLVELQWPALRGEWVRRAAAVDHAAIWARRVAVPIEGRSSWGMAPEDLLIHLCLHLAINHGFGEPALRNLLDVHLVASRLAPNWDAFVDRAKTWRLATMLWTTLSLAVELWSAPVPDSALAALQPGPARRRAIAALDLTNTVLMMRSGSYTYRRFVIQMLLTDRLRDAWRLVWRALFPETDWLRARYGAETTAAVWRERLLHPGRLLITARA
jgi:hypothetical protein